MKTLKQKIWCNLPDYFIYKFMKFFKSFAELMIFDSFVKMSNNIFFIDSMAIDADKKPQTVHKHSGQTISQITRLVEIDIEKKKNNKTVQILSELTFPRVNVHEIAKQFYNYMIHGIGFRCSKKAKRVKFIIGMDFYLFCGL